jgi:serine/threonine protein kinase
MATSNVPKPADAPAKTVPVSEIRIDVPEHELIRRIGSGGSGEVWLARSRLGTHRAVKIIKPREGRSTGMFASEFSGIVKYEPVSRLHEGLVDILQVGGAAEAGYFYYVMELADDVKTGAAFKPENYRPRTLHYTIRKQGRLPVGECIRLGAAMSSALGYLHRQNLIHRDLKPSNIIFVNGFPKLADIGLLTNRSELRHYVGTEGFIAPEGAGTIQADIYSIGKVIYEMSTGLPAVNYPALPENLGRSRDDLELAQFSQIVVKCCRTNPRNRFRSADEVMTALLSFQYQPRMSRWSLNGRPRTWFIAAAGALLGAGFIIFLVWRLVYLLQQAPQ